VLHKLKQRTEGFTIIEVLIVLAIAGLIILIVLLAVPALQRNSRNTSIKNDASALAGAVSSFQSNNDGAAPTTIDATGKVSSTVAGTSSEQAKLQPGTTVATITAQPTGAVIAHGTLSVRIGANCAGTASARATAVWYSVETTSAETAAQNNKCVDA
jgi:prepilin-type N-terminal cleavage/methylation domain-containing protein